MSGLFSQPLRRATLLEKLGSSRAFTASAARPADFTHTVVGAGVVGLAIARALALHDPSSRVLLLERHRHPGTETTSRNSEVVHAALYYGHGSLKTRLCLTGKGLLYAYCEAKGVAIRRTGKWLVAQDDAQAAALERVAAFAAQVGDGSGPNGLGGAYPTGFSGGGLSTAHAIPMARLTPAQVADREPAVRAAAGALESSSTGIVDSHGLVTALLGDVADAGGTVAFGSDVLRADRRASDWEVWTADAAPAPSSAHRGADPSPGGLSDDSSATCITTEMLINAAGLSAIPLSNMVLNERREPAYAKGTYYRYDAPSPRAGTLVYPAPVPGHGGLGTHLTLDMGGRIRFGPDVEWVADGADLAPNADPDRLAAAIADIKTYLPGLDERAVAVDYCGIRPKLRKGGSATAGTGFEDFYIEEEKSVEGFVNLLGIESPGLTASLAIGDHVRDLLYR